MCRNVSDNMKEIDLRYKIDLHIHSAYSYTKDKSIVSFNILDNIDVLVEKLNDNCIQMCAITDHDSLIKMFFVILRVRV
jgi:hypothetical protein